MCCMEEVIYTVILFFKYNTSENVCGTYIREQSTHIGIISYHCISSDERTLVQKGENVILVWEGTRDFDRWTWKIDCYVLIHCSFLNVFLFFMIEGPLKTLPLNTLHLSAENEKLFGINMKTFKMRLRLKMHTISVLTYSKCHDSKMKHQSWIVIYSHDRLHYFDIAWHFDAACESQTIFLMYLNLEIHVHFIDFKISSAHVIQLVHILCLV